MIRLQSDITKYIKQVELFNESIQRSTRSELFLHRRIVTIFSATTSRSVLSFSATTSCFVLVRLCVLSTQAAKLATEEVWKVARLNKERSWGQVIWGFGSGSWSGPG